MTTFFDDLEAQLQTAARAQIAADNSNRRTTRARARSIVGKVPVLLVIGTSVLVGALALVLLRHGPAGTPTTPHGGAPPAASGPPVFPHLSGQQRKQINYVMKADGAVLRRDRGCAPIPRGVGDPGRKPSLSQGSPSMATLATLGTLRRPATATDRLPPRIIGRPPHQHVFPTGTVPAVRGVYDNHIRYARHRDGANYYLVPAQNVNWRTAVPARCYHEQVIVLRRALPQIPRGLRPGIFALQDTYLAYERRSAAPYPGVCLTALNATGNGDGGSCYALSQIEAGYSLSSGAPGGVPVVYGLAPDGVHSVTLYYKGRYPGRPLTALVINNVFVLHNPRDRFPNYGFPNKVIWRAADSRLIKTITYR